MKPQSAIQSLLLLGALFGGSLHCYAQWQTQSITLKQGWNGVYLHVDPSHKTIDEILGDAPIDEVWLWKPAPSNAQFADSQNAALDTGSDWLAWKRDEPIATALRRFAGNGAYLVLATTNFTWQVTGQTVPPHYQWTSTGENFFGFPTPAGNPPVFNAFLSHAPALQQAAEIFGYDAGTDSPGVFTISPRGQIPVTRGTAFWIRAKTVFNRYYGPFELLLQNPKGVFFGDSVTEYRIRLRNLTEFPLTVTLRQIPSADPPFGQEPIIGEPPIIIRGDLDPATRDFAPTALDANTMSWTLEAQNAMGSEAEIILALDRDSMEADPGDLYGSILRFTDEHGLSQVDIPATAWKASRAGLWVGEARLTGVRHELDGAAGTPASALDQTFGDVERPFSLRLIIHVDNNTGMSPRLLQRVYYGLDADLSPVLATSETDLNPEFLALARRISAVHLPWSSENSGWVLDGAFDFGQTITGSFSVSFDDHASNPFLHTYHPDHDNLDAEFEPTLSQGGESYTVVRTVTMALDGVPLEYDAVIRANRTLTGTYAETIMLQGQGSEAKEFHVSGSFTLNRVSEIGTLVTQSP